MDKHPVDAATVNDFNPHHWADESFKISEAFVYKTVKENEKVSDAYIKDGRELAEKQVVIAGNRLANLLMTFPLEKLLIEEPVPLKEELIQYFAPNFLERD